MKKLSSNKKLYYEIICKSLVGTTIEIISSRNSNDIGIKGVIVLETKNDFILHTQKGDKRLKKENISFECVYEGKTLYMDGNLFFSTLQTRIKKVK